MLNLKEMIHLDTMMKTGNILAGIAGALLVPTFEYLYGEGEVVKYLMTALVFFIAMDWISGVRAAKKDKTYASKYSIDGKFRTFFILILSAGSYLLDNVIGSPGLNFRIL